MSDSSVKIRRRRYSSRNLMKRKEALEVYRREILATLFHRARITLSYRKAKIKEQQKGLT